MVLKVDVDECEVSTSALNIFYLHLEIDLVVFLGTAEAL